MEARSSIARMGRGRFRSALVLQIGVLGSSVCGGRDALRVPGAADGSATVVPEDAFGPAPCPSISWPSRGAPALVAITRAGLLFLRADGTRSLSTALGAQGGGGLLVTDPERKLVAVYVLRQDGPEPRVDAALFDREGELRWRLSRPLARRDGRVGGVTELWLASNGAMALGYGSPTTPALVAVLGSGAVFDSPVGQPLAPPDDAGWIPVRGLTAAQGIHWGFVNATSGEVHPLQSKFDLPGGEGPVFHGGRFLYVTAQADRAVLVAERPTKVERASVSAPPRDVGIVPRGDRALVTVRGGARWLWRFQTGEVVELDIPASAGSSVQTHVGHDWALITESGLPRWRVNLDSGQVFGIVPARVQPGSAAEIRVEINGRWAFGWGGYPRWTPAWRLDLAGETLEPFDLSRLRPHDPIDSCGVSHSPLQADGSIALGLRDRATGGLYVGHPDQAPWRRIGRSVADVAGIGARQVGETWIVESSDGRNTFCPPLASWPAAPGPSPPPLRGNSLQVQPPGDAAPLLFKPGTSIDFHASGRCMVSGDGVVRDLIAGTQSSLGAVARVLWW